LAAAEALAFFRPAAIAALKGVCFTVIFGSERLHTFCTLRITPWTTGEKYSEMRTVTTCLIWVLPKTSGKRSANMSMMTSAVAPESENWCTISEGV